MSIYSASDQSSPHVQERGSLRTLGEGRSQFIGSSTGVYFVNTVRRAFADANTHLSSVLRSNAQPSPEDCIVADEDDLRAGRQRFLDPSANSSRAPSLPPDSILLSYGSGISLDLGRPPPRDIAIQLFMNYFRDWHPFFPFLHGPTIGEDIETLYQSIYGRQSSGPPAPDREASPGDESPPLPLARVVILQCVFNLASLHSIVDLPPASRLGRPERLLPHLLSFTTKGDIDSIQALFAAQLLLVARMSLRNAAIVAGLLSRAIFLVGLHRCPVRYMELTPEACDMRKRVFWSIYVVDRFLSQALGHPLGIQDSDIDVCPLEGLELHHRRLTPQTPSLDHMTEKIHDTTSSNAKSHSHGSTTTIRPEQRDDDSPTPGERSTTETTNRHQTLAFHAEYSRLCGRALEIFHKSIHIRSIDPSTVFSLCTDLEAWWNSLPSELQELCTHDERSSPQTRSLGPHGQSFNVPGLFILLYNQLRLLIHRPWLSLEPSTPEFRSALQVCIGASRNIISNVQKQHDANFELFWPGYLSATWMAGIVLTFACRLELYPASKGQREINVCLRILSGLSKRWPLAKNCHTVLSDLHETVRRSDELARQARQSISISAGSLNKYGQFGNDKEGHKSFERPAKRVRLSTDDHRRKMTEPQSEAAATSPSQTRCIQGQKAHASGSNNLASNLERTSNEGDFDSTPGTRSSDAFDNSQRQDLPNSTPFPNSTTQSGGGFIASPDINQGSDNGFQWTSVPGLSGWDCGMPDLLHGVTWESLFQTVSEENLGWGMDIM